MENPRFVFLGRLNDALGPDHVVRLYRVLSESSITYLTMGEEHGLVAYHDTILEVHANGEWRVTTARDVTEV